MQSECAPRHAPSDQPMATCDGGQFPREPLWCGDHRFAAVAAEACAQIRSALAAFAIGGFLSGCAVQTDEGILAGPALTLGTSNSTEAEVLVDEKTLPTTIAVLPLGNQTTSDLAIGAVRQTLSNHFSSRNYRVMSQTTQGASLTGPASC